MQDHRRPTSPKGQTCPFADQRGVPAGGWSGSAGGLLRGKKTTYSTSSTHVNFNLVGLVTDTTSYTSFDVMGNVLASSEVTGGGTYNFGYSYNLAIWGRRAW